MSVCPYNIVTGYTLFVEDEERSANAILTRSDMESHMVRGRLQLLGRPWNHALLMYAHMCFKFK